jgi:hypothetical protein
MSPLIDLSGIQTPEVPKTLNRPLEKPWTETLRGYMQILPTFGPKYKNHGIRAPQSTWFTHLRIFKSKDVGGAYLQKDTQFLSYG